MKKYFFSVLLIFLPLLLLSCEPAAVRLNTTIYQPTLKVDVLKEFPSDRAYEKIALLTITDEDTYPPENMLNLLTKKAKEMGANALVLDSILSKGGDRTSISSSTTAVWAYAIRYK